MLVMQASKNVLRGMSGPLEELLIRSVDGTKGGYDGKTPVTQTGLVFIGMPCGAIGTVRKACVNAWAQLLKHYPLA